jgi:hypothetical protein
MLKRMSPVGQGTRLDRQYVSSRQVAAQHQQISDERYSLFVWLVRCQILLPIVEIDVHSLLVGEVVRTMGRQQASSVGLRSPIRSRRPSNQFLRPINVTEPTSVDEDKVPLLHLRRKVGSEFQYSSKLTYVS